MARRVATFGIAAVLAVGASAWVLATEARATLPAGEFAPRPEAKWPLTPERGAAIRAEALRRARVRLTSDVMPLDLNIAEPPVTCRFLAEVPTGTSAKFDCVLEGGEVIKVKYGRNPEIAAEAAATRLLTALGYPADRMTLSSRVRCYGCPRFPFFAMRLLQLTRTFGLFPPRGDEDGFSEFEWVAVERKFPAAAIELPLERGWAWWELKQIDPALGATRAEIDALRLLAVFLAHWDNKAENQRLVCLDSPAGSDQACGTPVAMVQDLGATFGPAKLNLARWRALPLWADRATCTVTMRDLPWHGGTFPDARISEEARLQTLRGLEHFTDRQIRGLFAAARFAEHYSATANEKDVHAWHAAFRHRVDQIKAGGPCPQ